MYPREKRFSPGKQRGNGWFLAGLFFALLLLPALAIVRLAGVIDWRYLAGYALVVSTVTYLLYRGDKKKAQEGSWRTPESTLHFAELLGGWPGAFLAQRIIRHKNAKSSYQTIFWMIVLAYQYVSLDFTWDWTISRKIYSMLQ